MMPMSTKRASSDKRIVITKPSVMPASPMNRAPRPRRVDKSTGAGHEVSRCCHLGPSERSLYHARYLAAEFIELASDPLSRFPVAGNAPRWRASLLDAKSPTRFPSSPFFPAHLSSAERLKAPAGLRFSGPGASRSETPIVTPAGMQIEISFDRRDDAKGCAERFEGRLTKRRVAPGRHRRLDAKFSHSTSRRLGRRRAERSIWSARCS